MTLQELETAVYVELKEGDRTSPPENYPLSMITDFINEGYLDVFNQPNSQSYLREQIYTFQSAADTSLSAAASAGDTTLTVVGTTNFESSGKVLLGNTDIVTYTGKTATALTGCTGVSVDHVNGAVVRHLHSLPSGIDQQKITYLKGGNTTNEYFYVPYERFLSYNRTVYLFSILEGRILFSEGLGSDAMLLGYLQDTTEMVNTTDTPSLIPERFHKMLVFYAAGRALLQEQDDRGYIYYNPDARGISGKPGAGLYYTWLHRFYAKYGRRTARKHVNVPFKYIAR